MRKFIFVALVFLFASVGNVASADAIEAARRLCLYSSEKGGKIKVNGKVDAGIKSQILRIIGEAGLNLDGRVSLETWDEIDVLSSESLALRFVECVEKMYPKIHADLSTENNIEPSNESQNWFDVYNQLCGEFNSDRSHGRTAIRCLGSECSLSEVIIYKNSGSTSILETRFSTEHDAPRIFGITVGDSASSLHMDCAAGSQGCFFGPAIDEAVQRHPQFSQKDHAFTPMVFNFKSYSCILDLAKRLNLDLKACEFRPGNCLG